MKIVTFISDEQDKLAPPEDIEKLIEDCTAAALEEEGIDDSAEVSVTFVDNEGIRELNKEHRDIDRETDVLSFPLGDDENGYEVDPDTDAIMLGDIVISLEKAKQQAEEYGHSYRRWLALCNRELSALITELLGDEGWATDLDRLKELKKYADDESVLRRFMEIKKTKKQQLAEFIEKSDGVKTDPGHIFDIQIKRLHEYKRQLLNAFSILYLYYEIKDGNLKDFTPTTFIFGAKSAPGYYRAKGIIKYINEVAKLVNSDPATKDLLNVVFVSNYRVSYAEKLVAAADISEQISTAGIEASGTGNMKFMLNGAVTLGTLDGANVEIAEEAGAENEYIFGATVEELERIMPSYIPRDIAESDPKIKRVVSSLIDGTVSDGGTGAFRELYYALMEGASWHVPDRYYLLGDLRSYVDAKLAANRDYRDSLAFAKKCWLNICSAGKFSSDRTIAEYANDIWHIGKVSL